MVGVLPDEHAPEGRDVGERSAALQRLVGGLGNGAQMIADRDRAGHLGAMLQRKRGAQRTHIHLRRLSGSSG